MILPSVILSEAKNLTTVCTLNFQAIARPFPFAAQGQGDKIYL